jgi:uncharacterized protein with HEPN domain
MNDEIKKWLYDIFESISTINEFVGDIKIFENYEKDKKLRRAVEREIEIIGEAVNRIQKIDSGLQISSANQIIATRNRVIHAYDAINNAIIRGIVIKYLPILEKEIKVILNN